MLGPTYVESVMYTDEDVDVMDMLDLADMEDGVTSEETADEDEDDAVDEDDDDFEDDDDAVESDIVDPDAWTLTFAQPLSPWEPRPAEDGRLGSLRRDGASTFSPSARHPGRGPCR